jgi:hypothetical protein
MPLGILEEGKHFHICVLKVRFREARVPLQHSYWVALLFMTIKLKDPVK